MSEPFPSQIATYRVGSLVRRLGQWSLVRVEKGDDQFLAKISPQLPFDSDSEGQIFLRHIQSQLDEASTRTCVRVHALIYDPRCHRAAIIYVPDREMVCWNGSSLLESEFAFRLWFLCAQGQLDGNGSNLNLDDVWIDGEGRAWIDPAEPERLVSKYISAVGYQMERSGTEATWQIPEVFSSFFDRDCIADSRSAIKRFYGCATERSAHSEAELSVSRRSFRRIKYARFENVTLIEKLHDVSKRGIVRNEPSFDFEWFNGWFWEPCEFNLKTTQVMGHRSDNGMPFSESSISLDIHTVSGFVVEKTNHASDSIRARSSQSDRACLVPLGNSGGRIRVGSRLRLNALRGTLATVSDIRADAGLQLEVEPFWCAPFELP